jgi:uncharacterized membrane protein YbhN (UPF0104 family)
LKKKAITALKLIVSGLLLYFVFNTVNTGDFVEYLSSLPPFTLFASFTLVLSSKYIAHFRLLKLFQSIGAEVPSRYHWKLYLQGMFYNLFLPGGIGGDAYKGYAIQKQTKKPIKPIIGCLLIDRIGGLYALGFFGLIFFILNSAQFMAIITWPISQLFIIAILFTLWIICTLSAYYIVKKSTSFNLSTQLRTVGYSLVLQGLQIIATCVLLEGLSLSDHTLSYLFLFTLSSIVSVLPITLGGIGAREVTFFYGAQLFGIESNGAVALSISFFVVNALVSLIGIYFHFRKPMAAKSLSESRE